MTIKARSWIIILIGIAFAGAALLLIPAENSEIWTMAFAIPWLVMAVVAGVVAQTLARTRVTTTYPLLLLGFMIAIVIRVIIDELSGRGGHNLWPLEALIAATIGLPGTLLGAFAGKKIVPIQVKS